MAYQSSLTQEDPRGPLHGPWIFLNEAQFGGPAPLVVPEPASAALWVSVIAGLATGTLAIGNISPVLRTQRMGRPSLFGPGRLESRHGRESIAGAGK